MRLFLTHCSKLKDPSLKGTGRAVTPDKLYTDQGLQQFVQYCRDRGERWGILSDKYGVVLETDTISYYEKPPGDVTPGEEREIVKSFNAKLRGYDEIIFYARRETFHPFYRRVLEQSGMREKIRNIYDL